jgi:hypothetical protein
VQKVKRRREEGRGKREEGRGKREEGRRGKKREEAKEELTLLPDLTRVLSHTLETQYSATSAQFPNFRAGTLFFGDYRPP